jgi:hypothetical protein
MVLTGWWQGSGPNGEDGLTRMTYSRVEGNAVRQFGQFSADNGATWQTSFDFIYRPHVQAGDRIRKTGPPRLPNRLNRTRL